LFFGVRYIGVGELKGDEEDACGLRGDEGRPSIEGEERSIVDVDIPAGGYTIDENQFSEWQMFSAFRSRDNSIGT